MLALIRGLNTVNGVKERRNYIFLRLRACVYTVIMMIMILILLILVVFGERIVDLLTASFPNIYVPFAGRLALDRGGSQHGTSDLRNLYISAK